MAKNPLPTPEQLRQLLDYEPVTGVLTWRERPAEMFTSDRLPASARQTTWNARFGGKVAGFIRPDGYRNIQFGKRTVKAHRVAWALHFGEWPASEIDHINHVRSDNRIANLRVTPRSKNARNKSKRRDNSSGFAGVSWHRRDMVWRAYIQHGGRQICLGSFAKKEDAIAARKAAKAQFSYHPNHGIGSG